MSNIYFFNTTVGLTRHTTPHIGVKRFPVGGNRVTVKWRGLRKTPALPALPSLHSFLNLPLPIYLSVLMSISLDFFTAQTIPFYAQMS